MRIDLLELDNYGSYQGHHELPLDDLGLLFVRGDNRDEPRMNSNGAGKSSGTCEPLEWCLFGVIPKGDHVDSIVNRQEGKNTRVAVHFSDGPDYQLKVERFRKQGGKKSGLRFWANGEERTTLDTAETQRLLELELGLDHQVFRAAVVFGQKDRFQFADASDKDRIEVCTKLFQMEEIDTWQVIAKALRDETRPLVEGWQREVTQRQAKLTEHEALQATILSQAERWTAEYNRTLEEYAVGREALEGALRARLAEKEKSEVWLGSMAPLERKPLEAFLPEGFADWEARRQQLVAEQAQIMQQQVPRPAQLVPLQDQRQGLELRRGELRGDWKAVSAQVLEREHRVGKYRALGVGVCRECGQDITREHLDREIQRLEAEIGFHQGQQANIEEQGKALDAEIQEISSQIVDLERAYQQGIAAQQARVSAHQVELAQVIDRIRAMQSGAQKAWQENELQVSARDQHLARVAAMASEIVDLERHIMQSKLRIEAKRAEVNPFVAADDGAVEALRASLAEAQGHVEQGERRMAIIQFWIDACGPDGIKSYVMDTRLYELTQAANEGVLAMTGGTHWVQLDTVTAGRTTKTVRNKINVRVFKYDTTGGVVEQGYLSYSGGECQRVSLGIDFGLAGILARRARKQYEVLFLDELFRHLDQAGKEAVVDLLGQLRATKRTVCVIEHDDEFRQHFDNELLIIKEGGRSRFVLEAGHGRVDTDQAAGEAKPQGPPGGGGLPFAGAVPGPEQAGADGAP